MWAIGANRVSHWSNHITLHYITLHSTIVGPLGRTTRVPCRVPCRCAMSLSPAPERGAAALPEVVREHLAWSHVMSCMCHAGVIPRESRNRPVALPEVVPERLAWSCVMPCMRHAGVMSHESCNRPVVAREPPPQQTTTTTTTTTRRRCRRAPPPRRPRMTVTA